MFCNTVLWQSLLNRCSSEGAVTGEEAIQEEIIQDDKPEQIAMNVVKGGEEWLTCNFLLGWKFLSGLSLHRTLPSDLQTCSATNAIEAVNTGIYLLDCDSDLSQSRECHLLNVDFQPNVAEIAMVVPPPPLFDVPKPLNTPNQRDLDIPVEFPSSDETYAQTWVMERLY